MTPEEMAVLRAPFEPEQIGQIPKGGVQLDYVGHADVTDRLIKADPDWTWEPMGRTVEGLPALDGFGNLWIRLTVCGVTRPGVGDGKSMKECVGDALRNAAMRFGVALDLWAKGDRNFGLAGHDAPEREQTAQAGAGLRAQVMLAAKPHFADKATFEDDFNKVTGVAFAAAGEPSLREYLAHLNLSVVESPEAPVVAPEQGKATAQPQAEPADTTPAEYGVPLADPIDAEAERMVPLPLPPVEDDIRDRVIAVADMDVTPSQRKARLTRLLVEANNAQVKGAMVQGRDELSAITLEALITGEIANARAAS